MCTCLRLFFCSDKKSSPVSFPHFCCPAGVKNIPVIEKFLAPGSKKSPASDASDVKMVHQIFML